MWQSIQFNTLQKGLEADTPEVPTPHTIFLTRFPTLTIWLCNALHEVSEYGLNLQLWLCEFKYECF